MPDDERPRPYTQCRADLPDGKPCPRSRIMPGPYCLEHDTADADHPLRWMIDEGIFATTGPTPPRNSPPLPSSPALGPKRQAKKPICCSSDPPQQKSFKKASKAILFSRPPDGQVVR